MQDMRERGNPSDIFKFQIGFQYLDTLKTEKCNFSCVCARTRPCTWAQLCAFNMSYVKYLTRRVQGLFLGSRRKLPLI
jgi:hypothetical protein